jgi:hypothetical protein
MTAFVCSLLLVLSGAVERFVGRGLFIPAPHPDVLLRERAEFRIAWLPKAVEAKRELSATYAKRGRPDDLKAVAELQIEEARLLEYIKDCREILAQPYPPPMIPCTEFDFSALPRAGEGTFKLTVALRTADRREVNVALDVPRTAKGPELAARALAMGLCWRGYPAEVIEKTKVRVYGRDTGIDIFRTTGAEAVAVGEGAKSQPQVREVKPPPRRP